MYLQGSLPNFWCSFDQPSTTPGTVTERIPSCGIAVLPSVLRASIVSAFGAQPLPHLLRPRARRPVWADICANPYVAGRRVGPRVGTGHSFARPPLVVCG